MSSPVLETQCARGYGRKPHVPRNSRSFWGFVVRWALQPQQTRLRALRVWTGRSGPATSRPRSRDPKGRAAFSSPFYLAQRGRMEFLFTKRPSSHGCSALVSYLPSDAKILISPPLAAFIVDTSWHAKESGLGRKQKGAKLFVRSFVRSFVCSFARSFVRWFVRSFVRSLVLTEGGCRPPDPPL